MASGISANPPSESLRLAIHEHPDGGFDAVYSSLAEADSEYEALTRPGPLLHHIGERIARVRVSR